MEDTVGGPNQGVEGSPKSPSQPETNPPAGNGNPAKAVKQRRMISPVTWVVVLLILVGGSWIGKRAIDYAGRLNENGRQGYATAPIPLSDLSISKFKWWWKGEKGKQASFMGVGFTLTNNSTTVTVNNATVLLTFMDSSGDAVDTQTINTRVTLVPGQAKYIAEMFVVPTTATGCRHEVIEAKVVE